MKPVFLTLLICAIAACGRAPTETERAFLSDIHGSTLDLDRMRLHRGAPVLPITFTRAPRPRTSCREKLFPPLTKTETVKSKPVAVALGNHIYLTRDWYLEDFLAEFPQELNLVAAMLYAHEATHVWQWQNREKTGYTPLKAAAEHGASPDPYLFELETSSGFLDFGYEQQGTIVEEYVCCRALDPVGARTKRLHDLLLAEMPVAPLPQSRQHDVRLPWRGVELQGICS